MDDVPSATWRMLAQGVEKNEMLRGMDAAWDTAVGFAKRLVPRRKRFLRRAERIVAEEKCFRHMTDGRLRDMAAQLYEKFRLGRETVADCDRALGLAREVAARQVGLRPYPVQVAGAIALDSGCIAEMATGEGKTLAIAMASVLAGWRGRGCHVVTANEYLAKRDAESMGAIYKFCGLEVSSIQQDMTPTARRQAYSAHVTYCTNKEVAADFLRDRLVMEHLQGTPSAILAKLSTGWGRKLALPVQRGLECAIVDEADSVLIDEAVTPLIISGDGCNYEHVEVYKQAAQLAGELKHSIDYRIQRRYREVKLTQAGKQHLAGLAESINGLWKGARRREELVVQAIVAREFFIQDKQYIVDSGKVVIVDEFTGRLMPDRSWRDGLHQAIEAKEGLEINLPKETYARISFQRFFRFYKRLSGMTGTGAEAATEFWQIYHRSVVMIPTHRPCIRFIRPDRMFSSATAKWDAVIKEVCWVHKTGRPILVGTRSVQASEYLSNRLASEGLAHQVLNAVRHEEEAEIIAKAGNRGCITVATNMAGRGTDIQLGEGVADLGGLYVIATERHEAHRIDRQLYGRCARQGDSGGSLAFISLNDELMQQHARLLTALLVRCFRDLDREISFAFFKWFINRVQQRCQRAAFHQRKTVLHTDRWIEENLGFAGRDL